jgi:deazaflavin-dependent oxidoreductase (nitroreductase family)
MTAQNLTSELHDRPHSSMPSLLNDRRARLSRIAFSAPLALYRLGFGGLLGHQFLVLTHVGRRSGRVHETVLKVLNYDPITRESIVASAWGTRADWYRNLQARPALAIRTGRAWYVPEMRTLPPGEAFAVFSDWTRRQHWFAELMLGQIGLSWNVPEAEQRAIVARFPFIGFRPAEKAEVAA